jgi:predicted AAA+ superfamily ATPase
LTNYSLGSILAGREVEEIVSLFKKELDGQFDEYIRFGGYPEGVKEESYENKAVLLNEIHRTYIQRDINQMFTIENVSAFNKLIQLIALQIGNLVNLKELATNLGVAWRTVETYLFILENTFILKRLNPFHSNKRKELSKMPKVYFHDTGLMNQMVKNSNPLEIRADAGALVENYLFQHLYRNLKIDEDLKFWRSQNGNEVDFVIESNGVIPIEVKYSLLKEARVPQGIRFFLQKYPSKNAVVVTRDFLGQREVNGCKVSFLPACLIA